MWSITPKMAVSKESDVCRDMKTDGLYKIAIRARGEQPPHHSNAVYADEGVSPLAGSELRNLEVDALESMYTSCRDSQYVNRWCSAGRVQAKAGGEGWTTWFGVEHEDAGTEASLRRARGERK